MDPFILSAPYPIRFLIVNGIIAPFRSKTSAQNYAQIWDGKNFPLPAQTESLTQQIQDLLPTSDKIFYSLAFSDPDLKDQLEAIKQEQFDEIRFIAFFPQWATSTTFGSLTEFKKQVQKVWKKQTQPKLTWLKPFYNQKDFITKSSENLKKAYKPEKHEVLLMSYHGIPVSHLTQFEKCKTHCTEPKDCCLKEHPGSNYCYLSQCLKTTEILRSSINHPKDKTYTSFQSRLGPAKWLEPSTLDTLADLAHSGVKHILLTSPSFTVDCLETLEELDHEAKDFFIECGGETLDRVPCLNDNWATECFNMISDTSHYAKFEDINL